MSAARRRSRTMAGRDVILTEEQLTRADGCLQNLLTKTKAVAVIFADARGQPYGQAGRLSDKDRMAISTLAAGSFAATVAMAKLLGQSGAFEQLFFEGKDNSVYSSTVGEGFLLTIIFNTSAKPGLVRLLAQEAAKELQDILREAQEQAVDRSVRDLIDAEFGNSLAGELDAFFPGQSEAAD